MILDAEGCVDKAVRLLGEAAAAGAELAVLPETFVSVYPSNAWAAAAAAFTQDDPLWERLWQSSVDVPGPLVDRIAEACAEHQIHCVIGVNEREQERPGTLYNTMLLIGPSGLLHKHRKLMPTHHERLFHGVGAGDDLDVVADRRGPDRRADLLGESDAARALGCLPRRPADLGGADRRRLGWLARDDAPHRDRVGRVRRLRPQFIPARRSLTTSRWRSTATDVYGRAARSSWSRSAATVIAGPLRDAEGIVLADCDLRVGLRAKRLFDVVRPTTGDATCSSPRADQPPVAVPRRRVPRRRCGT